MTLLEPPISAEMPPTLENGDRMTREEFHRIYEQMPEDFKAELIGGMVHLASPLRRKHATLHASISAILFAYQAATPGVELGDNATVILGNDSEPQPDLYLRVLPECGGKTTTTKSDHVSGPPELIVEIAHSSKGIDLHAKRDDYVKYGVTEYLVVCIADKQLRWFDLKDNKELGFASDGIIRIESFPGLWIDAEAVFLRNFSQLMKTLNEGLATPGHAAFALRLSTSK